MKVCKFGGTSLADASAVSEVCNVVTMDPDRRLVVVSAPGKRTPEDTKVTDLLIACAEDALRGAPCEATLGEIVSRYDGIARVLGVSEDVAGVVEADLRSRLAQVGEKPKAAFLDSMKAAGEDNSAKLVASALRARGHDARYVDPLKAGMRLTADFGNAQLLPDSYERLAALADEPGLMVFPGFFGYTPAGDVVTFPRGGSDITGSILAAAVKADLYENFTDVDSVFAVDPRIVPDAAAIPELTFREMRELAYAGFSVLHEEAILPAIRAGIPICIRNTHRPDSPGTRIVPRHQAGTSRVVGIASGGGFCSVYVSKYLMNREIGFGRKLLEILEDEKLSFEHTPSGIDNMSVILRESGFDATKEAHVLARIRAELGVDDVDVERGLALIMIVGEGMRFAVGMASRATQALASAGVNIEMMNQGSSEISMMFGVKVQDRKRAVESLYRAFFTDGTP